MTQVLETSPDRRVRSGGYRVAHRLRSSDQTIAAYVSGVRRQLKRELISRDGGNPDSPPDLARITAFQWSQIDAICWSDSVLLQCAKFLSEPDRTLFEKPGQVWSIVNDTIPRYISIRNSALRNLGLDKPPAPLDIHAIIRSAHEQAAQNCVGSDGDGVDDAKAVPVGSDAAQTTPDGQGERGEV